MKISKPLRKVATTLMAKFGTAASIKTITPGIYNANTGSVSRTTSSVTVKGIFEDVTVNQVNDLIRSTDRRFTVAAADLSVAPTTADVLTYGGKDLEIIEVTRVEQDGVDVIYQLIIRG